VHTQNVLTTVVLTASAKSSFKMQYFSLVTVCFSAAETSCCKTVIRSDCLTAVSSLLGIFSEIFAVTFLLIVHMHMHCVNNRDAEIKDEVKRSREDRSPKSGRPCHRNGKVDQENSQRIPVIRYGELIVLGYV